MSFNLRADRPTIVVGCTLGLVLIFILYWMLYFWLLRQDFVNEIDAIQPRTSRLLGMVESFEKLQAVDGEADDILRGLAYSAERDSATTAAAMQQNIREVMVAAGMSVTGSQILPLRAGEGLDRLSLDITAAGNIDALDEALANLEEMRPLVFVDALKLKPVRSRSRGRRGAPKEDIAGDPRKLTAQFQLFSLRLQD